MSYFEKNGRLIFNVLFTTFSSLVFIANFFVINHRMNTALYFLNIMSLILATVMILIYPNWLYNKYKGVFLGLLNSLAINVFSILVHIVPVYLFRVRQSWQELLEFNTIYDSAFILLLYYVLFEDQLSEIYPLNKYQLITMCSIYYLLPAVALSFMKP